MDSTEARARQLFLECACVLDQELLAFAAEEMFGDDLLVEHNVVEVKCKDHHHSTAVAITRVHVQDVARISLVS